VIELRFCPKCGGLLVPSRDEKGNIVLKCNRCGYVEKSKEGYGARIRSEIKHTVHEKTIIVEKEIPPALPTTKILCPRCGHNVAYYWMIQTRAGDEPPTRFFKCVKCGYVWREYD